jgi:Ser/Thr protein kinase RdoA (MazF antagonist)
MTAATDDETQGRLTRDKLDEVLAAVGARADLDVRDAQLVKFTNNAVFRLTRAPVVVRIAGSATMRSRVPKIIHVARWLAQHDAPAVRLLPDVPQPLAVDGHLATLWRTVPSIGPKPSGSDLGAILRRFHTLPAPPFELPSWKPVEEIRQRLDEPEGLDPADLAFLLERCDAIEEQLARVEYVLPSGPIHGDAFLGNLIAGPDGPVICDFDSSSTGPREWDLTPVAVGKLRFDYPGDAYSELARSYGFDVTQWRGFPILRQIRELKLVTSVVPILRSNPSIYDQWAYRLQSFKRGDTTAKWTTYR